MLTSKFLSITVLNILTYSKPTFQKSLLLITVRLDYLIPVLCAQMKTVSLTRYIKLRISIWKQDPSNPIRTSDPTVRINSLTLAPVTSNETEMELMEDTRWAGNAFATSFESSDDF